MWHSTRRPDGPFARGGGPAPETSGAARCRLVESLCVDHGVGLNLPFRVETDSALFRSRRSRKGGELTRLTGPSVHRLEFRTMQRVLTRVQSADEQEISRVKLINTSKITIRSAIRYATLGCRSVIDTGVAGVVSFIEDGKSSSSSGDGIAGIEAIQYTRGSTDKLRLERLENRRKSRQCGLIACRGVIALWSFSARLSLAPRPESRPSSPVLSSP